MIRLASQEDKERIISTLSEHMTDNIYLYIDIQVYGIKKNFIKVWIEEKNSIIIKIILKYYNSFQIFITGKHDKEYEDIIKLILDYKPAMISGKSESIKCIYHNVKNNYSENYGKFLEQICETEINFNTIIEFATISDMKEIAKLICMDKGIGGHYTVPELEQQLVNRLINNIGRNILIRKDNKIVAHYATYAEAPGIAVMGGLIVHPDYRGNSYGKLLHIFLSNTLIKENKRVFLFCHDMDILKMYLKLGAKVCSDYGKLTIKSGGN